MIGAFACLVLSATGVFAQKPTRWGGLHGVVVDASGAPVADVLVVASGVGFRGWSHTEPDGSYYLASAGLFLSFRHAGFEALLVKTSDLREPARVVMEQAVAGVQKMPSCGSSSGKVGRWVGIDLRINSGRSRVKGPYSDVDYVQWFVMHGKDFMQVDEGATWGDGLPL